MSSTSTIPRFSFVVAVLALAAAAYPAGAATENVILTFVDNNGNSPTGSNPTTGLISDAAGNLYGTTYSGIVYELSQNGEGGWNETILHTLAGSPDGQDPAGDLILDNMENL